MKAGVRFSKIFLNFPVLNILRGFFGSFSFKKCFSKSPKVFRIDDLQYFGISSVNPSWKGHSRLFFCRGGGHQTEHIFYPRVVLLGFCNVSISCHSTVRACQISSDYWLFA